MAENGPPDVLLVLLHGLDHSPLPMAPLARAVGQLQEFLGARGAPFNVRVEAPYRGGFPLAPHDAPLRELERTVETVYSPLSKDLPGLPIVTIGESLGAAIAELWAESEPRIVFQVGLDPLPSTLNLHWLDRLLIALAMVLQCLSFRLRGWGLDLSRVADDALVQACLDGKAASERRDYGRQKMTGAHRARSELEARWILRSALFPAEARAPDALPASVMFLPAPGSGFLEERFVGPLMTRIATHSIRCRSVGRIALAGMGNHFNLSEYAAPYIAWETLCGVAPRLPGPAGPRLTALLGDDRTRDAFVAAYWGSLEPRTRAVPAAPLFSESAAWQAR